MIKHRQNQRGAVSIFVVVFSALFVTIITVGFVGLMIRGQQQATNADLSNSAYDAALAGVEDGKRVLLRYRQCLTTGSSAGDCGRLRTLFATPECNMVKYGLTGDPSKEETMIQSASESGPNASSKSLDQAYTCVTIDYTSPAKVVQVVDGGSVLVPIDSNGEPYNSVVVSWFTKTNPTKPYLDLPSGASTELPTREAWNQGTADSVRPPILRAQWIQHGNSLNVTDFDSDQGANANTKTTFLYPSTVSVPFPLTDDRSAANPAVKAPQQVRCQEFPYNNGSYACTATLALPDLIGAGGRVGYLQLGALYSATEVRIALTSNTGPVEMVAPTIDSTGRANDLFRRVKVGVSFSGEYPQAAFDISGNLCKDFSVTNDSFDQGNCNPDSP